MMTFKILLFIGMMLTVLILLFQIVFLLYQCNKYRKLANIERKKLERLGIYIDESPML